MQMRLKKNRQADLKLLGRFHTARFEKCATFASFDNHKSGTTRGRRKLQQLNNK
jgi:hypothetical protein